MFDKIPVISSDSDCILYVSYWLWYSASLSAIIRSFRIQLAWKVSIYKQGNGQGIKPEMGFLSPPEAISRYIGENEGASKWAWQPEWVWIVCHWLCFLHLHKVVEGLYFHCSLSVCLCVCVSGILVNKIPADLNAVFAKWLLTTLARTLLKLVTLGQRSRPKMYVKMMNSPKIQI